MQRVQVGGSTLLVLRSLLTGLEMNRYPDDPLDSRIIGETYKLEPIDSTMEEKALDCKLLKELSTLQLIHAFPPQTFFSVLHIRWPLVPSA